MSDRTIKVCQYVPHGAIPDKRGFAPALVAQNYLKTMNSDIVNIFFITNQEDYKKRIESTIYGEVFRIKESKLYRRLFKKITKIDPYPLHSRAANIINQNPINIFHAHQIEFNIKSFKRHLKNKQIKIIVHSHVTVNTFNKKNGIADLYIAPSDYVKSKLIQNKYPKHLIHTVTNGIDTTMFKPIKNNVLLKKKYNIEQDKIIISFVGRKQEIKKFDIFLFLAKYILDEYSNIVMIAVGSEPKGTQMEKSFTEREKVRNKLKEDNRFIDLDPIAHDKLAEIYQITDLTILLSNEEPQGMTMVESISSGCITLSTATGGILETITNGYNGFLLAEDAGLAETIAKVEYIIDNLHSSEMQTIKTNARKVAVEKFDNHIITNKLQSLYEELMHE